MKYWVGVASADHVNAAVASGFVQLGHGKSAPVRRLLPGDLMAFYSPRSQLHAGVSVQSFTAIGRISDREPYLYPQTPSFSPTRRDVTYFKAQAAPIEPLLGELSFIHTGTNWGLPFRRGLIEVSQQDMRVVANAMKALDFPF
ncbi:MAG: EVE domain-containing protein [Candidatus Cybelea sp.]